MLSLSDTYNNAQSFVTAKGGRGVVYEQLFKNARLDWVDAPAEAKLPTWKYMPTLRAIGPANHASWNLRVIRSIEALRVLDKEAFLNIPDTVLIQPCLGSYLAMQLLVASAPPKKRLHPHLVNIDLPSFGASQPLAFVEVLAIETVLKAKWSWHHIDRAGFDWMSHVGYGVGVPVSSRIYSTAMHLHVSLEAAQEIAKVLGEEVVARLTDGVVLKEIEEMVKKLEEAADRGDNIMDEEW